MCGIAGILAASGSAADFSRQILAMTDALRHRGPDDGGIEMVQREQPVAVFGHRRLAIIDLSPQGHQPMSDPELGTWITFNGEIYNYRELRQELAEAGQAFCTRSDTEVILKAYAAWGADCVRRLRGIFAFAIWDPRTRSLLLARDQLGVKPLYHWFDGRTLAFASEVRSLLASSLMPRRLDAEGLRSYLAYGSVQEPLTLVKGIRSLSPGHTLTWHDGTISYDGYWRLPSPDCSRRSVPGDVYSEVRRHLEHAVEEQLVSDVPLGAFLSGGIDSTAIAALMSKTASGAVKTCSIVFEDVEYDERRYARIASASVGSEHTEIILSGATVRHSLPKVLPAFDQPSVDGVNTYFVAKAVREAGLTVALSGVGGDELFGGYDGYRKALQAELWFRRAHVLPLGVRQRIAAMMLLDALPTGERTRKIASLLENEGLPYFVTRRLFSDQQIAGIMPLDLLAAGLAGESARFADLTAAVMSYDPINRVSALEMQTYMLSTLLRDTDQMSMAHALEVRVPLIAQGLVEYLFTLPGASKVDDRQPKPLLTRALGSALPSECIHRPKRGFALPFDGWLRNEMRGEVQEALLQSDTTHSSPLQTRGLRQVWQQFEVHRISWSRIWALYVLEHWLRSNGVTP